MLLHIFETETASFEAVFLWIQSVPIHNIKSR